jgi:hypothetical protein
MGSAIGGQKKLSAFFVDAPWRLVVDMCLGRKNVQAMVVQPVSSAHHSASHKMRLHV